MDPIAQIDDETLVTQLPLVEAELLALQARWHAIAQDWNERQVSTPFHERQALLTEMEATRGRFIILSEEFKYRRVRQLKDRHHAMLLGWKFSDQMLAALTHLVERAGLPDLVQQARSMASTGWPNHPNHQ